MNLLVNSDIVNLLLKTNGGETEGLIIFYFFVVWNALIVGGWVVVVWSRKSFQGQLKSYLLCSWFYSRMGDAG